MARPSPRPRFESWGRYPTLDADLVPLNWTTDFPLAKTPATCLLPVGAGRSYGDVCLLENGTLLQTRGMDRLLAFDPETGVLRCEAGVTLAEILDFAVPRGFFLPVTPGNEICNRRRSHRQRHSRQKPPCSRTFGHHVLRFELVRSDGTSLVCSATENPEWFAATIGGMGLTGLITWAEVRLRPIVSRSIDYPATKFVGIDEFLTLAQNAQGRVHSGVDRLRRHGTQLCPGHLHAGRACEGAGRAYKEQGAEAYFPFRPAGLRAQPLHRGCLQHRLLPQADPEAEDGKSGLRAVLLSAGQHPAMESAVWEAWTSPVPECVCRMPADARA